MTNRFRSSRRVPIRILLLAVPGLLAAALLPVPAAVAAPAEACDRRTNNPPAGPEGTFADEDGGRGPGPVAS